VKARDLAHPYPALNEQSGAVEAARVLAEEQRPGLIVVDDENRPVAVLPGSQVLRLLIPNYIRDDPTLAGVVDDDFVEHMCDALADKTVVELLPKDRKKLPVVAADDTLMEVAAVMAAERSPLVAVVEGPRTKGALVGAITLPVVLGALLPRRITGS
jgi:CBS domain-containing protein